LNRSFAFIFVCQGGELEAKGALLAASLRRFLRCKYELIAAIPGPADICASPRAATISILEQLGVRIVAISNSLDPAYPIANKIECLRVQTDADKLVFLDSDMLLMREFADEPRFDIPFNARPASCATFTGNDDAWQQIYRACDARIPTTRIRTTHSGEYILPYFNAGFVAVPGNCQFGDAWLECCRRIDAMPAIPNKRPYLDQIALGVAAAKLGLSLDCLDERYNHPINFKPLRESSLPYFCHYHDVETLSREPKAVALVQSLVTEYPALNAIVGPSFPLAPVLRGEGSGNGDCPRPGRGEGRSVQADQQFPIPTTPELLITGIPRSGTSYLCNLLHRFDNCVVLNEPVEAPAALMQEGLPWGVARLLRDVRRDVLLGKPTRNKLVDGNVTEDTAVADTVETYTPSVTSPNFVLGIKATVAFLSRIPALRRVLPDAKFVAVVRNPLDTIASWNATFDHLRSADVANLNVGSPSDSWLSGVQRTELSAVAAIPDAPSRRAAWWRYLAGLVLESRDHLILVHYDELATSPLGVLERILGDWPAGTARRPIEPSRIRRRRENLEADDYAAIRAICAQPAAELGLSLEEDV
jgi:hypothetical protein